MSQQSKYCLADKIRLGFEEYISSWKCCQVQYDIPVVALSSLCQDIVRESFGFVHSQKVDDHHHVRRLSVTDRCKRSVRPATPSGIYPAEVCFQTHYYPRRQRNR